MNFNINKRRKKNSLESNPAKIIRQESTEQRNTNPLLCGSCGTLNAKGSIFCVEDGTKLDQVNNKPKADSSIIDSIVDVPKVLN